MKKLINYLVLGALFSAVLISCDVSDSDEPAAPMDANGNIVEQVDEGDITANDSTNFRKLLTDTVSKSWDATFFTLAGSDAFTQCRLDDSFTFYADGKYDYVGGRLCGAEDNQANRSGNWELDYTEKKIYFDRGTRNEYVAEVIGLQEDELRVKGTYMRMEVRGLYSSK